MRLATSIWVLCSISAVATPTRGVTKRQAVLEGSGCASVDVKLPRTVNGLCASPALEGQCTLAVRAVLRTLVTTTLAGVPDPLAS